MIDYTTSDKLSKIDVKDVDALAIESNKLIISNEAYAQVEALDKLTKQIEALRLQMM